VTRRGSGSDEIGNVGSPDTSKTTRTGLAVVFLGLVCADSSQAKGRVERANGTLQDRLVKEMRPCAFTSRKFENRNASRHRSRLLGVGALRSRLSSTVRGVTFGDIALTLRRQANISQSPVVGRGIPVCLVTQPTTCRFRIDGSWADPKIGLRGH